MVTWTLLVLASLLAQREQLNRTASALARIDAVANLKKDMSIRKWASDVKGVFILEDNVPPINSLDEEERLIGIRGNGETLRLVTVTPIHLLLAIQEASNRNADNSRERLTSKQLRNQDNAPDDWEQKALDALEKGGDMVTEVLPKTGKHGLMRAMIPMRMEEECLECHRDTLVPVGGLRGGATIAINLNAYRTAQQPTWQAIQYWHLGIWILGLTVLFTYAYFARHRGLEKLRSEEERRENEMAFAAMAEGAIITDPGGRILWVNDAFCRISGYAREEVINQNPRLLKSGLHDAAFYRQLWAQLTSVGHWRGELWNQRKNGEIFPEEISIQALKGPDGQIRRFISIFSEISERKRNEKALQEYHEHLEDLVRQRTEELTEARDEAEAANRSKSTFLANMSHELRTPLNAVIGFSQLMEKDPQLEPTQRRNVEIINSSGNHLLTLINDILELSKIESGKMEICAEEVDLPELLAGVVGMMSLRAEQGGLALKLELPGTLPLVVLDPLMLRQVLLNLLSNAIKFTPSGSVTLHVDSHPTGDDRLELRFAVADTGIGISAEDQARIFHSFEQVGGARQGGTGLGLTISQQYVRMMGGELLVASEPDKGATFSFAITVGSSSQPAGGKADKGRISGIEPADHGRHILIVDDIPEARLLVRSLLEPFGFRVSEAASAAAAETLIAGGQPDLVLLDWFMPDDSGLALIARIRGRSDIRQPHLIMLTANATDDSRRQALNGGADDFVSKPFEEDELLRTLARHLALHLIRSEPPATAAGHAPHALPRITADDLLHLGAEARAVLAQAALSLNPDKIADALRIVARENPELAERLGEFATTRQYQALWQLLGILEAEEWT
ncbi:MAG: response regulator [Dechloromonas sp.]|nr:MAG: response regulator [Dechloromonas sp.]